MIVMCHMEPPELHAAPSFAELFACLQFCTVGDFLLRLCCPAATYAVLFMHATYVTSCVAQAYWLLRLCTCITTADD